MGGWVGGSVGESSTHLPLALYLFRSSTHPSCRHASSAAGSVSQEEEEEEGKEEEEEEEEEEVAV